MIATGAVSGIAMSSRSVFAAHHEAMTQTKETQGAITPDKALQMLKDGNARFVQGKMLERDYNSYGPHSAQEPGGYGSENLARWPRVPEQIGTMDDYRRWIDGSQLAVVEPMIDRLHARKQALARTTGDGKAKGWLAV